MYRNILKTLFLICLTPSIVFACEGYKPDSISKLPALTKIILGPKIILAAAGLNISSASKEIVANFSLYLVVILIVVTLAYIAVIFYKNNKLKILITLVVCIYFASNLLTFHSDAGSFFCNGKPTILEVFNLLLSNS